MSPLTTFVDFLVSNVPLCVFAPAVDNYVSRTSDPTIVVQAPTAIQRMTITSQTQNTSSREEQGQLLEVPATTPVEKAEQKLSTLLTPKK
ncbi:hypothetical protein V1506DRAFT_508700 [Lipomyces tetrasporus]